MQRNSPHAVSRRIAYGTGGDHDGGKVASEACHSHRRTGLRSRRRGQGRSFGRVLFQFVKSGGVEHRLKSIAFPAISTGVYGYPLAEAAAVSSRTIEQFLSADKSIEEVRLVFFAAGDAEVFLKHHSFTGRKAIGSIHFGFWIEGLGHDKDNSDCNSVASIR